jgi:hypothetical protein
VSRIPRLLQWCDPSIEGEHEQLIRAEAHKIVVAHNCLEFSIGNNGDDNFMQKMYEIVVSSDP